MNKNKSCNNFILFLSQNDEDSNSDSCSIKELDVNGKEQTKFKVKYLHFNPKMHKRPPYYGTWRKKSKKIKPRAPFAKDDVIELVFSN